MKKKVPEKYLILLSEDNYILLTELFYWP